jgi:hypothetical protein
MDHSEQPENASLPKSGFIQRQGERAQVRAKVAFIATSEGRLGLHE